MDLLPQLQSLLDEEREALKQYRTPSPSTSDNLIDLRAKDTQSDQQQQYLRQSLPEALATTQHLQEGPRTSPSQLHSSQRASAVEERSNDVPTLNPPASPAMAAAICLMVEDPYFDTPMSSPSSEEAPVDSSEEAKQWAVSPIFSTPSLCLNDQTMELDSAASGKYGHARARVSPEHRDNRKLEFDFQIN